MNARADLFDEPKRRFSEFALKDYELKVAYLTNHFQRMWTRFNYFVVIETALIGGKSIFGDKMISGPGLGFGLGLSLVWYVMGAEDRFLVQLYREQVKEAATLLSSSLWQLEDQPYHHVGELASNEGVKSSLAGWRREFISTTRLASLIPFAVTMVWVGLSVVRLIDLLS